MDKQVVFKTTAFGGFEKKAVLDYIYKLNEDAEATQADLHQKLDSIAGERQSLSEAFERANQRISTLQQNLEDTGAELAGERSRGLEMGNLNEGLREELERDRAQLRQREEDLGKIIQENRSLKEKNDEFVSKQDEVNETVSRIGMLMLDARSDADQMLKNAEEESKRLLEQTEEQSKATLAEARRDSDDLIENARASVGQISGKLGSFRQEMLQARSLIADSLTQLERRAVEIDMVLDGAFEAISMDDDILDTCAGAAPDSFFRCAAEK